MNTNQKIYTIEEIKEKILPIKDKYEIESIYLFGSYARNEAKADSDIDLIIKRGKVKTLIDLYYLNEDLEQAFHKKIDVLIEDEITEAFMKKIEKDLIKLY